MCDLYRRAAEIRPRYGRDTVEIQPKDARLYRRVTLLGAEERSLAEEVAAAESGDGDTTAFVNDDDDAALRRMIRRVYASMHRR